MSSCAVDFSDLCEVFFSCSSAVSRILEVIESIEYINLCNILCKLLYSFFLFNWDIFTRITLTLGWDLRRNCGYSWCKIFHKPGAFMRRGTKEMVIYINGNILTDGNILCKIHYRKHFVAYLRCVIHTCIYLRTLHFAVCKWNCLYLNRIG